jgi:hypothetical protein
MTTAVAVDAGAVVRKRLDPTAKQKVSYAIPMWLRDQQIAQNLQICKARLEPRELRDDPIAIVCYGPSLNETWKRVRDFKNVLTCSGAHKFLIDRGIVPRYHVDVDPREHKIKLIGEPHRDVEYLLAATCYPKYFKMLVDGGYDVKLWHIFDAEEDSLRLLPEGEWALTGGCSVGLRAMTVSRILGFREFDVFGMDGNEGATGKHASDHPNQAPQQFEVEVGGRIWLTTPGFLAARARRPAGRDGAVSRRRARPVIDARLRPRPARRKEERRVHQAGAHIGRLPRAERAASRGESLLRR